MGILEGNAASIGIRSKSLDAGSNPEVNLAPEYHCDFGLGLACPYLVEKGCSSCFNTFRGIEIKRR
jgi:hypothetical protein